MKTAVPAPTTLCFHLGNWFKGAASVVVAGRAAERSRVWQLGCRCRCRRSRGQNAAASDAPAVFDCFHANVTSCQINWLEANAYRMRSALACWRPVVCSIFVRVCRCLLAGCGLDLISILTWFAPLFAVIAPLRFIDDDRRANAKLQLTKLAHEIISYAIPVAAVLFPRYF